MDATLSPCSLGIIDTISSSNQGSANPGLTIDHARLGRLGSAYLVAQERIGSDVLTEEEVTQPSAELMQEMAENCASTLMLFGRVNAGFIAHCYPPFDVGPLELIEVQSTIARVTNGPVDDYAFRSPFDTTVVEPVPTSSVDTATTSQAEYEKIMAGVSWDPTMSPEDLQKLNWEPVHIALRDLTTNYLNAHNEVLLKDPIGLNVPDAGPHFTTAIEDGLTTVLRVAQRNCGPTPPHSCEMNGTLQSILAEGHLLQANEVSSDHLYQMPQRS